MDNASKAFNAFRRSELFTSERNNQEEEYINAVSILNEAGHTDFVSPLEQEFNPFVGTGIDITDESFFKSSEELQANFWAKVSDVIKNDENAKQKLTEAGLDSFENMQKTIATKSQNAWKEYTETNLKSTTAGMIGGFTGIAGGAFTDPIMLSTIPISFGYSVPTTFGRAALKVALMEGIIAGVAETVIQLKSQPYRAELGFEDAGFETGLKNVLMVTGGAAAISPALLGLFKAAGKGMDAVAGILHKTPIEDLQKIHKELGDANPKYKDKNLEEIKLPEKDIPDTNTAPARAEHNERLNSVARAVAEGEAIDLPAPKNKIIYHSTDKKFNEFDLNKTADQSIWFSDDLEAIKAGKVGASGQGNIIERFIDENKVKLASAEEADKYVDQQLIAMGYDGVKFSKAEGFDDNTYRIFNPEKLKKINEVNTVEGDFNKKISSLADDQNNIKDFDVPTEATLRNQASNIERSEFDVSTSSSIKSEAGAGAAAKTSPTEFSDGFQILAKGSQITDATPVSVLAKANMEPPLFRGSDTSRVGSKSAITNKVLYHKTDDFNVIYDTLSAKMADIKKELQPVANKFKSNLKARIKEKKELQKKINSGVKPESISDYLGTRISTDSILQAKLVLADLSKSIKLIHIDDFLNDAGRPGSEYRAIHAQALTKDGFTFEIQIRLKELDPLTDQSHITYKKKKFPEKEYTDEEFRKIVAEDKAINKQLKEKYFEIKEKEFEAIKSTDPLDEPIVVGIRLDENGEKVTLTKTARELFEEEAKDNLMLQRLKDCV